MWIKEKKLCTIGGITKSAFIGGPLAAFYLMSKNYRSMNQTPQAILSLCFGLFFTFITFGLLILLDNNTFSYIAASTLVHNNMLSHHSYFIMLKSFMRAASAVVIGILASMLQATSINTALQSGVKKISILEIISISVVSVVISTLFFHELIQISQSAFVEHYLGLAH